MADIRLLFNKSCDKKRKNSCDEEESKLLASKKKTKPVLIEYENRETRQSETVVCDGFGSAQVRQSPNNSDRPKSECDSDSETDDNNSVEDLEEKADHGEGDELVSVGESDLESASDEDEEENESASISASAPG